MSTEATGHKTAAAKDVYAVCQQNVDKFMEVVKQSVPRYHQSVTNTQQEYVEACENIIGTGVTLQKEFAYKTGMTANIPDTALRVIHESMDEAVKAIAIQNQIALAAIDATQQNIKTFNGNAKAFADLNRNVLKSWISAFTTA